jgi:hypothetical protein
MIIGKEKIVQYGNIVLIYVLGCGMMFHLEKLSCKERFFAFVIWCGVITIILASLYQAILRGFWWLLPFIFVAMFYYIVFSLIAFIDDRDLMY